MTEEIQKRILPTLPQTPTIIVLFGITGDLVRKKILSSLFHLYSDNLLPPHWSVVGTGRRAYTDETLRAYLKDILLSAASSPGQKRDPEKVTQFLQRFYYEQGQFDDTALYTSLGKRLGLFDGEWKTCANKLFYLSIPPHLYKDVLTHLDEFKLTEGCSDEEGWTRVILEKPFGNDLQEALALDTQLSQLFDESQVYRVDHYLAKETVRNIIALRFSNQILVPAFSNKSIQRISVRMSESLNTDERGSFYDAVGALRDVGQNHLLQLIALFTMDNPGSFEAESIRAERAKALQRIHVLGGDEIKQSTARAQYKGYTETFGVKNHSQTETYFRVETYIDDGAFAGVPVTIEAGKALAEAMVEVEIVFKHIEPCLCSPNKHENNILRYSIQPDEKLSLNLLLKVPGHKYELASQEFVLNYHDNALNNEYIDPYALVFLDIIKGDQSLFVSTDEVVAQWAFVQPIIQEWSVEMKPPLVIYEPGAALSEVREAIPFRKK